jgi:deoxyribodipyrimidine photo-lyase
MEPTRAAGLARLAAFAPRMGRAYAATRNHDSGPGARANVSVLSPWVRHRLVLEAELAAAAAPFGGAAEKFVSEVFWRTYFKGFLERHPAIWAAYTTARAAPRPPGYEAAIAGRTGIACFDAWAHELVETGYLHNHARMWFASIWIFTLRLPWALGADFTFRHFADGDPASNTLSWRWVAGLHTRGKHYLARAANISEHTAGRFDPRGELDERAPPLVEDAVFRDEGVPASDARPEGPVRLVLHEDDCLPETLLPAAARLEEVLVLPPQPRGPRPTGTIAHAFAHGALADAAARAGAHFAAPVRQVETLADIDPAGAPLVTAWPTIGPLRDAFDQAHGAGLTVAWLRRPWDSRAWPHAGKGFFALRQAMPALLDAAPCAA